MYMYIHGFGGSGKGIKAELFRKRFEGNLIAPSLSYVPELAVDTLSQIVESILDHTTLTLIGSSLGGYYATWLAEHYGLKAVLINPSTRPYETLKSVRGYNYFDESLFDWNQQHVASLHRFDMENITPEQYLVLLQKGDELLDYTKAELKYQGATLVIEEGGNHSYEGIESKFDLIDRFAHQSNYL